MPGQQAKVQAALSMPFIWHYLAKTFNCVSLVWGMSHTHSLNGVNSLAACDLSLANHSSATYRLSIAYKASLRSFRVLSLEASSTVSQRLLILIRMIIIISRSLRLAANQWPTRCQGRTRSSDSNDSNDPIDRIIWIGQNIRQTLTDKADWCKRQAVDRHPSDDVICALH